MKLQNPLLGPHPGPGRAKASGPLFSLGPARAPLTILASILLALMPLGVFASPALAAPPAESDFSARLDYFAKELRSDFDLYGLNERRTIRAMERLAQLYRSKGYDREAIAL
ncbi:MAG: hypothetical protein LBE49_07485, partial [Deltaproteobacteria bacterium]|nr:hypothetical protein [Deltaproteobacteria bacterium]